MNHSNTIIIITGPTAVGKTAFAIQLAQHFNTEIISADSRQCYKELNIGVAKPDVSELLAIKHHFINSHSIYEDVNAGLFEQYALEIANNIFKKNPVVIMVGGTGLYIKVFCEGIDAMPDIPEQIRDSIISSYQTHGIVWLQNELQQKDPSFWAIAEQHNPQRLMRALEILYTTGKSILQFRTQQKIQRPFNIVKIGLELPKEELHKQIHTRVDKMMLLGLQAEAKFLLPFRNLNALQTVGYREFFDYFDNKCSLENAIEQLKINTRRYAKRQMTWFKKDDSIQWIHPDNDTLPKTIRL